MLIQHHIQWQIRVLSILVLTCRVRLLSLAAQRFIATALHDAMQIQAKRQKQPSAQLKGAGHDIKDKRPTLTIEDLAQALQEACPCFRASPQHQS